jgi:hypothetical protein
MENMDFIVVMKELGDFSAKHDLSLEQASGLSKLLDMLNESRLNELGEDSGVCERIFTDLIKRCPSNIDVNGQETVTITLFDLKNVMMKWNFNDNK